MGRKKSKQNPENQDEQDNKLELDKETLRDLDPGEMEEAAGGAGRSGVTETCLGCGHNGCDSAAM